MELLETPPAILSIGIDPLCWLHNAQPRAIDGSADELPPSVRARMVGRFGADGAATRDDDPASGNKIEVTSARSMAEAVNLLRVMRFDLVLIGADELTDQTPRLLDEVHRAAPEARCIVVSKNMSEQRERAIREAGVLALVETPLPLDQLHEIAGRVAARARYAVR